MKQKRKHVRMSVALFMMAVIMITGANPMIVNAKTQTVVAKKDEKKAPTLKLDQLYFVKANKRRASTKFIVPETGKYEVAISHFHMLGLKKDDSIGIQWGYFYMYLLQNTYMSAKTQGGSTNSFKICTPAFEKWYKKQKYAKGKVTVNTPLARRTAVFSAKKGTVIYVQSGIDGKQTYNLRIKKR